MQSCRVYRLVQHIINIFHCFSLGYCRNRLVYFNVNIWYYDKTYELNILPRLNIESRLCLYKLASSQCRVLTDNRVRMLTERGVRH